MTAKQSVVPMDKHAVEAAIKLYVSEIRQRLDQAARIAQAAEACAKAGNVDEAVHVALRFEPIIYEAERLLAAVTLLKRLVNE